MTRTVRGIGACALALLFTAGAYADCSCKADKTADGWCNDCKLGHVAGVQISSKKLYTTLQGKEVKADYLKCAGCKDALAKSSACKSCKLTFTGKKSYRSTVGARLASGTVIDIKKLEAGNCSGCKTAVKSDGWCKSCNAGMVAGKLYPAKDKYKGATKAHTILVSAVKTAKECETCAIAMVTDGNCTACKVTFKDGKKIE